MHFTSLHFTSWWEPSSFRAYRRVYSEVEGLTIALAQRPAELAHLWFCGSRTHSRTADAFQQLHRRAYVRFIQPACWAYCLLCMHLVKIRSRGAAHLTPACNSNFVVTNGDQERLHAIGAMTRLHDTFQASNPVAAQASAASQNNERRWGRRPRHALLH